MTLSNRISNWLRGVEEVKTKGSINAGKYYDHKLGYWVICKYDWSKQMTYTPKTYQFENWRHYKKRLGDTDV